MKLTHDIPCPSSSERAQEAKALRDLCTEVARLRPHATTLGNGEEADYAEAFFPSNFTKGLMHDPHGILAEAERYRAFVEAINSNNWNLFESDVKGARDDAGANLFNCQGEFPGKSRTTCCPVAGTDPVPCETRKPEWRGWESPRAGHVFDLQGPDAGAVGMAPAPRIHSSELAAEMAEVYALALLRDIPFSAITEGTSKKRLCDDEGEALLSGNETVNLLNDMPFFNGKNRISSTPMQADDGLNSFERNRRHARTLNDTAPYTAPLTTANVFRGSTPGAQKGPYISQFMLIGGKIGGSCHKDDTTHYGIHDGLIPYGTLRIDQRTLTHQVCLDYMTDWASWLDVQNGADLRKTDRYEAKPRFITTPRDLATYVHFDALYEAYLNAALVLLALEVPHSRGFPEPSLSGRRTGFATFGGPHILSLVTEVATRCLKAVRRQKFNFHRRARPEALGGRLTLVKCGKQAALGCAAEAFEHVLCEIPDDLLKKIADQSRDFAGLMLDKAFVEAHCALTVQGELDKLAANVAIGRNMAGVHYYSDYYDSLRVGERVAVGILLEQAPGYGEAVDMTFTSFDGDFISISGHGRSAPTLTVIDRHGSPIDTEDWWLRHVPGEGIVLDLT